jgi:hypothetical protein
VPRPLPRLRPSAFALLLAAACSGAQGAEKRSLRITDIDPESKQGVFLNEPLTIHFTEELDPLSVSRESVVIETEQGERARGSLSVEGDRIVFRPDVPHAPDLSDGGYRPGALYQVRIAGFPSPDGIRAASGRPLAQTRRGSFTTVALDTPRRTLLFDDPHQEHHKPPGLFPGAKGAYTIGVGDAIYVGCEKQIDPTSVRSADFKLLRKHESARESEQSFDLFARLVENEAVERRDRPRAIRTQSSDEAWRADPRAALIELTPVQRLEPGSYVLIYLPPEAPAGEESWSLRDFSRNKLLTSAQPFLSRTIVVVPGSGADSPSESFVEDFVDAHLRTPRVVPDCDGTATWEGTGRVEVHYPLAAGDGSAEAVALGATEERRDLQATRIDLAEGLTCRLSEAPGLVILRAQGRFTLRGVLERRTPFDKALDCDPDRGLPLSTWLERARAADPSWTVLIAGGDLVIEGEIRSDVPVLLIAGGQVRDTGKSALAPARFWSQSGAGSLYTPNGPSVARFELDPPVLQNPLRAPLRYAVVSGPVPATGRVARWISAYATGGFLPSGKPPPGSERTPSSFSVHYFPADSPQTPEFSRAPTSPVFLTQPGAVRFVVELVLGDQPLWRAPYVDRVQLDFEQAPR